MAARGARTLAFSGWNGRGRWEVTVDKITERFEDDGVEKFNKPFDKLMETLAKR
jgi:transaldolase